MTPFSKKGTLEVIAGCMFSGKSETLMGRIRIAGFAKKKVLCCTSMTDSRTPNAIWTRAGGKVEAVTVREPEEILVHASQFDPPQVVVIDEAQFFPKELLDVVEILVGEFRVKVIAAGLDTDFLGKPFETMALLLAAADEVLKLVAVCTVCGDERATRTQRLNLDGKPASADSPRVLVGNVERYEARCRSCHAVSEPFSLDRATIR